MHICVYYNISLGKRASQKLKKKWNPKSLVCVWHHHHHHTISLSFHYYSRLVLLYLPHCRLVGFQFVLSYLDECKMVCVLWVHVILLCAFCIRVCVFSLVYIRFFPFISLSCLLTAFSCCYVISFIVQIANIASLRLLITMCFLYI